MTSPSLAAFGSVLDRLCAPLLERLNPILVKEVRQALRGRYFMVVFWLTLAVATVCGTVILVIQGPDPHEASGIVFFQFMFGCLGFAVHVFVPFAAFLSLGSEWDENTHDLLVLTNLRPGQIVWGKLLSAGIQVLLFYAAFGPFLAFSFLLQGVDLLVATWALGSTLLSSLALVSLAIALSSITSLKFVRIFLLAFLTAGLTMGSIWLTLPWVFLLHEPGTARDPYFLQGMLGALCGILAVIAFASAFAAARLAHPEENRSTALRVLGTAVCLVGLGWMVYGYSVIGELVFLLFAVGAGCGLVGFLGTFFATEPERLGRRVNRQVPRVRGLAFLLAPWFPGGGRGFLWLFLHLALVVGVASATAEMKGGTSILGGANWTQGFLVLAAYTVVWVGIPSLALCPLAPRLPWRVGARFAVPVVGFAGVFLPMLGAFFVGAHDVAGGRHPGNPAWVLEELITDDRFEVMVPIVIFAVLVVLANTWRMARGEGEMIRAAGTTRRDDVRGAATAVGGDDACAFG